VFALPFIRNKVLEELSSPVQIAACVELLYLLISCSLAPVKYQLHVQLSID